jgi:hypothetical protein
MIRDRLVQLVEECLADSSLVGRLDARTRLEQLYDEFTQLPRHAPQDAQDYYDLLEMLHIFLKTLSEMPDAVIDERIDVTIRDFTGAVYGAIRRNITDTFGYQVNSLSAYFSIHNRADILAFVNINQTGELGLIDTVGDGNCGPRAVIQSLLVRGITTNQKRFVADFLRNMYLRQSNAVDDENRSLYGCVIRRLTQFPDITDLSLYANSCVLVGEQLHYIDFQGVARPCVLVDAEQFKAILLEKIGGTHVRELVGHQIRMPYDELNMYLAPDSELIQGEGSIKQDVESLLERYEQMTVDNLPTLRSEYFASNNIDLLSEKDHVMYTLAGCLRFDIRDYARDNPSHLWGGELDDDYLGLLEQEMSFSDTVSYFANHRIVCNLLGRVDDALDDQNPLIEQNSEEYSLPPGVHFEPAQIDLHVYRLGNHFMTLLYENRDSVLAARQRYVSEAASRGAEQTQDQILARALDEFFEYDDASLVHEEAALEENSHVQTTQSCDEQLPYTDMDSTVRSMLDEEQEPLSLDSSRRRAESSTSTPQSSDKSSLPSRPRPNYSFLMHLYIHPVTQFAAKILFLATLSCLRALVMTGIGPWLFGAKAMDDARVSTHSIFATYRERVEQHTQHEHSSTSSTSSNLYTNSL